MSTANLLRFSLIVSHQISAVAKKTVPAFRYKSSNLHTVYNQSATTQKKNKKKKQVNCIFCYKSCRIVSS